MNTQCPDIDFEEKLCLAQIWISAPLVSNNIPIYRSKRRYNKSRKYGLITTSGADLEMEPLDQDVDEDDEMTMFERRK